MKKYNVVISVVIVLSLVLSLSGCAIPKSYSLPGKKEKEIINNQLEILISAIEDEDVDAIIDMFSKEALEEIEDEDKMDEFEDSIKDLIKTFPDWDGDYDDMDVREYKHNTRDNTSYRCYMPDISFTSDGKEYQLHLVMIYHADEEDRIGLRVIQLCDKDVSDYTSDGYYRKPGLEVFPGVYCWDSMIVERDKKYK